MATTSPCSPARLSSRRSSPPTSCRKETRPSRTSGGARTKTRSEFYATTRADPSSFIPLRVSAFYGRALADLALEGLAKEDFIVQKRNRWRLQGKSLYDIFGEVVNPAQYQFGYGILSESIHGSWNESMDWCLSRNDDGTFSAFARYQGVDARLILPLVRYATPPYVLWSDRIQIQDDAMRQTLDRIRDYSGSIYRRFDELYDGPSGDGSTPPERR